MKWNHKSKRALGVFGLLILALSAIGFVNKTADQRTVKDIVIDIEQEFDNFFVDQNDILNLMTNGGNQVIIGTPLTYVDLKELENRIYTNPFVKTAEVFRDMKGYILAEVSLKKPIARILNENGPDAYVSSQGEIFPTSTNFTARVILLDGKGAQKFIESGFEDEEAYELLRLIEDINQDPMWSKQITQISIGADRKLKMWPQVSKQVIEFGEVWNYEEKLKKLDIFYRQILPMKGWNSYTKVNLEFEDQIVAE